MTQRKIALSIEEAADYTGIGRNTLRQRVEWKKIPVLKVGRKVLIKTDILEMFMEANEGRDLRDTMVFARKKALCGRVCAYTSPANFMPQLMRVSYIRRVRARLSCGV